MKSMCSTHFIQLMIGLHCENPKHIIFKFTFHQIYSKQLGLKAPNYLPKKLNIFPTNLNIGPTFK